MRWSVQKSAGLPAVIIVFAIIWSAIVVAVNPLGDFPLNDDWCYGRTVQSLVEEGRFQICGWVSFPLATHVLWGGLFALPFGFSFTVLRFSTLLLGLVGVLGTYGLLREVGSERVVAAVGAAAVMLNPLYLQLSFTFMSDVPFYALFVLSLILYVRGVRRRSIGWVAGGTGLACLAVLNRQLGLALPLAFASAYVVRHGLRWRTVLAAAVPALIVGACLAGYEMLLLQTQGLPDNYRAPVGKLVETLSLGPGFAATKLYVLATIVLIYCGLFLFPVLALSITRCWRSASRSRMIVAGALFLLLLGAVAGSMTLLDKTTMPLMENNSLGDTGLGPLTLRDEYFLRQAPLPRIPDWAGRTVTALGVAGALMLVSSTVLQYGRHGRTDREPLGADWLALMALTAAALYILPVGLSRLFDRYLLPLLPLLMVVPARGAVNLTGRGRAVALSLAMLSLLAMGTFSVGATHDYLAWNRVRWDALRHLLERDDLSPGVIDGGFEFNGWYGYDPAYVATPIKSWWWIEDDLYIVTFGPVSGYRLYRPYTFERWIPPGEGYIFVLKRK